MPSKRKMSKLQIELPRTLQLMKESNQSKGSLMKSPKERKESGKIPSKRKISKFKDPYLTKHYELLPGKAKKASFGRCYFGQSRTNLDLVLVAMIWQEVFDQFQGGCGKDQLQKMIKEADPNIKGVRETIQCDRAVALVMNIERRTYQNKSETDKLDETFKNVPGYCSTWLFGVFNLAEKIQAITEVEAVQVLDDFLHSDIQTIQQNIKEIKTDHYDDAQLTLTPGLESTGASDYFASTSFAKKTITSTSQGTDSRLLEIQPIEQIEVESIEMKSLDEFTKNFNSEYCRSVSLGHNKVSLGSADSLQSTTEKSLSVHSKVIPINDEKEPSPTPSHPKDVSKNGKNPLDDKKKITSVDEESSHLKSSSNPSTDSERKLYKNTKSLMDAIAENNNKFSIYSRVVQLDTPSSHFRLPSKPSDKNISRDNRVPSTNPMDAIKNPRVIPLGTESFDSGMIPMNTKINRDKTSAFTSCNRCTEGFRSNLLFVLGMANCMPFAYEYEFESESNVFAEKDSLSINYLSAPASSHDNNFEANSMTFAERDSLSINYLADGESESMLFGEEDSLG
jgi:hypothetical protein